MAVKLFASSPAKALESLTGERDRRAAALEVHRANRPAVVDLDAIERFRADEARLAGLLTYADAAVAFQLNVVERAEAEAQTAEKDRIHAEAGKRARENAKLVREIIADSEAQAAKLARLALAEALIADANADRGDRPYIADGETLARQQPGHVIPAVFEDREIWRRADGSQPGSYYTNSSGELVPSGGDATKRRERVQISAERIEPARMPPRLSDAIKLVGLDGSRLWPAQS
jgi:hypothetical protein